jgi:hypothetical protein
MHSLGFLFFLVCRGITWHCLFTCAWCVKWYRLQAGFSYQAHYFQEQVDQQQVTEQMANVAIDDPADNWGQTETSQTDWNQQSESQTDWSQQTETHTDWNSSPGNQNECKSGDFHVVI